MEVNRSNFKEKLPTVIDAIKNSDFVAIDTEYTGLSGAENSYDTLPMIYSKKARSSNEFLIIQFGLATFKEDKVNNCYENACFNFYLFPNPIPGIRRSVTFKCESQSFTFLAANGFDFNKVFCNGISYLSHSEETKYRELLEVTRSQRMEQIGTEITYTPMANLSKVDQELIQRIYKQIVDWKSTASPDDELDLGKHNSYYRRVILNNVGSIFHGQVMFDIMRDEMDPNSALLTVVAYIRGDRAQQLKREDAKIEKEERLLEDAVGFSYVIRQITESGKLVLGHNMLHDLLHITNSFIQPLPADYYSFKDLVNVTLPKIIDTKYMASCDKWKDRIENSVLNQMVNALPNPEIKATNGCKSYSLNEDKSHEAAFDAFLTGVCFLSMYKQIAPDLSNLNDDLKPYLNRIFLYKITDIPYMNLGGKDSEPSRDNVLFMTFPSHWKVEHIFENFKSICKVSVSWLTDSSAYVVFPNADAANHAIKFLGRTNPNKPFELTTYMKYQLLMDSVEKKTTLKDSWAKVLAKAESTAGKTEDFSDDDSDNVVPAGEQFKFIRSPNAKTKNESGVNKQLSKSKKKEKAKKRTKMDNSKDKNAKKRKVVEVPDESGNYVSVTQLESTRKTSNIFDELNNWN